MANHKKEDNSPKFLVVVRSIVVDSDEKVLLLKRSNKHTYYPNKWELPGGRLTTDKDPWVGLPEIVDREAGIIINPISTRFYSHSRLVTEEGKYKGYIYIELAAESVFIGGNVRLQKSEHIAFDWVDFDDVFTHDLTLESKKALAQYLLDIQREQEAGKVRLINRALIRNKQNNILLVKRSTKGSFPGTWELPGGEFSTLETLSMVLKREVFEETGFSIDITEEVSHFSTNIQKGGRFAGKTFVNIVSEARIKAGNLRLSHEHSDAGWFSEKQLLELQLAPYMGLPITELFLKTEL